MTEAILTRDEPAYDEAGESARRFMDSALDLSGTAGPPGEFREWYRERSDAAVYRVEQVPFAALSGWDFEAGTGNLRHRTGRFFSIEGLRVRTDRGWTGGWTQPIIVQPEIGILGLLVKEFGGVLHFLLQAKVEPGNINGVQLSPTVQATRSNYTRAHGGSSIPYLDYFADRRRARPLVDVLQSEQGAWFLHKRNRNMVVEALDDVPPHEDFHWFTLAQIRELLGSDHVVNMDTRTVLSCVPLLDPGGHATPRIDTFAGAVLDSSSARAVPVHGTREVLRWITGVRSRRELVQERIPLDLVAEGGWERTDRAVLHRDGKFFQVIGVDVEAGAREVATWSQPLVAPNNPGLIAFLARRFGGTLHVLVQARVDAGSLNVAELAPTVQCQPDNYDGVPDEHRPRYLDDVLSADPAAIRYDVMQSEEGGRFYQAQNRYMVVEVGEEFEAVDEDGDHRWVTLHQLAALLLHSNYVNVEARSLLACMHTLW